MVFSCFAIDDVVLLFASIPNGSCHQNLACVGCSLRSSSGVHDRTDRRQVPVRLTEFTEFYNAAADTNSDMQIIFVDHALCQQFLSANTPPALHSQRRAYCFCSVVMLTNWKIENRHYGIADSFVKQSIVLPNSVRAFIVISIENSSHLIVSEHLGRGRVPSQIGKQDGSFYFNIAGLHNSLEHQLADRAGIWIHPARPNSESSEWNA